MLFFLRATGSLHEVINPKIEDCNIDKLSIFKVVVITN
jgi:hypothetical protein